MRDAGDMVMVGTRALMGAVARSMAVAEDVTLSQFRILSLLSQHGALSVGTLADRLDVNPSTITRACDRLVDKKLVRRRPDPDDRRTVLVELAPRGARLVDQVMDRRRQEIDRILSRMPATAQERLAEALGEFAVAAGELGAEPVAWPV